MTPEYCILAALVVLMLTTLARILLAMGPKYPCYNSRCFGVWELHELVGDSCCPNCGHTVGRA